MPLIPPKDISECNYFTKRALENEKKEKKGSITMWRLKGQEEFNFVMTCPFCGHKQERKEVFKSKPYRPVCENCRKASVVEKMYKKKAR